jgi:hypothetical protein
MIHHMPAGQDSPAFDGINIPQVIYMENVTLIDCWRFAESVSGEHDSDLITDEPLHQTVF